MSDKLNISDEWRFYSDDDDIIESEDLVTYPNNNSENKNYIKENNKVSELYHNINTDIDIVNNHVDDTCLNTDHISNINNSKNNNRNKIITYNCFSTKNSTVKKNTFTNVNNNNMFNRSIKTNKTTINNGNNKGNSNNNNTITGNLGKYDNNINNNNYFNSFKRNKSNNNITLVINRNNNNNSNKINNNNHNHNLNTHRINNSNTINNTKEKEYPQSITETNKSTSMNNNSKLSSDLISIANDIRKAQKLKRILSMTNDKLNNTKSIINIKQKDNEESTKDDKCSFNIKNTNSTQTHM